MTRAYVTIAFILVAAAGCGGDSDGAGTCESVNQRICDMACACADGDECVMVTGGATITHDNASDCSGFWVTFGCSQDGADAVDYAACDVALDSAACVETPGGDGMGLEFPMDCGDAQ